MYLICIEDSRSSKEIGGQRLSQTARKRTSLDASAIFDATTQGDELANGTSTEYQLWETISCTSLR